MNSRREGRQKLGELLAARGKLDRRALLEALRLQRIHGGRLGSCLLEIGAVSEDDLLDVLSDQLKLPFLTADDLRAIPEDVLRLVPAKVAAARVAVPVRASGTQLTVAMAEPHDLAGLDELAFVSGRRIRPHTALEVRLQEALARSYRTEVPSRFVHLVDRLNRARFLWREEAEDAASAANAPPEVLLRSPVVAPSGTAVPSSPYPPLPPRPGEAAFGSAPRPAAGSVAQRSAPSPAPPVESRPLPPVAPPPPIASRTPTPTLPPSTPAARPAPEPLPAVEFSATERRLQEPSDRDSVAEALVDFLRARVDVGLAMIVRSGEAVGWRGFAAGDGDLAELRVDLSAPSLVRALRDGAPLHRGALPPLRGNEPLRAWLGEPIADLLALPLRVKERTVGLVLAASRRTALAAELADELQRLAATASDALARLVLRRKQRPH